MDSEWERIPDSIRFVPAACSSHMAYFTARYRKVVRDSSGRIGWEEKEGNPVYVDKLVEANDALLAASLMPSILRALEHAEIRFGGPPGGTRSQRLRRQEYNSDFAGC